jgi:hypothetical protein
MVGAAERDAHEVQCLAWQRSRVDEELQLASTRRRAAEASGLEDLRQWWHALPGRGWDALVKRRAVA